MSCEHSLDGVWPSLGKDTMLKNKQKYKRDIRIKALYNMHERISNKIKHKMIKIYCYDIT